MGLRLNTVVKVTLLYLFFGLLWIYCSDKVLSVFIPNDVLELSKIQTFKGFFFVGVTAILLHYLVKKYNNELTLKVAMLEQSKAAFAKSEENYRLLFEFNPTPIIIYHPESDKIIKVNDAALESYGYSVDEFSKMSLLQLEDEEAIDVQKIEEKLNIPKHEEMIHTAGIHRHKKKCGKLMYVYIRGKVINYKGVNAHITMINNITPQLEYIETIERQNSKLNKIAWTQSHVVRAPLASLMGLVHLLEDGKYDDTKEVKSIHDKILNSANELDQVIRSIADDSVNAPTEG